MLGIILIPLQSLELSGFEFNSVTFPVKKNYIYTYIYIYI